MQNGDGECKVIYSILLHHSIPGRGGAKRKSHVSMHWTPCRLWVSEVVFAGGAAHLCVPSLFPHVCAMGVLVSQYLSGGRKLGLVTGC